MPFVYPKTKKTIEKYATRDFSLIDGSVRKALEDVEEWDPFKGMKGLKRGKLIYLLNTRTSDPPQKKADPNKFLVLLCENKGLNLGEIEKWLDDNFLNVTGEFHYDKTTILHIDERRMYYRTPRDAIQGGIPCSYITWYSDYQEQEISTNLRKDLDFSDI